MADKPKVLFATDGIFPHSVGGIQRHSRLLIEALARRQHTEIVVIHPHAGERIFAAYPQVTEVVVDPLPDQGNYLRALYAYSGQVAEVAARFPDHLVYAQGLTVWQGLRGLADRLIINPHGLEPYQPLSLSDWLKGWPYRRIFGRIFRQARRVISLGGSLTPILQGVAGPAKVTVLPNATELPPAEALPQRAAASGAPLKCLFVGRFAANKGITYLLEAAQALAPDDFQVTLAGKGPLYAELKARYQLSHVHMLGFVPDEDLMRLYQTHDVFVLPTLFEGMPTVVLEAMAYGMPIIVTDVGATLELVSPENGFIIAKRSPEAIVEALQTLRQMPPAARQALSQASHARVAAQFTWDAVAARHEALFTDLAVENAT